ncbi:MAG: DUF4105 domain-containing protein [Chitinophagia bacterium]|nr:DUF4105 domain-containing protein [Chitinophagia bacterium]
MKKKLSQPAYLLLELAATFILKKVALRFLFILIAIQIQFSSLAQDSSHIRISLLTCTPGQELYSTFGHTAIRITDSIGLTDYVFNYGTFNFEDDGFYTKFIRGKLLYYLSAENFSDFKFIYQAENRGITEQVLNLDAEEKIALKQALYENAKEKNRYYKYDFFFDNCTTRARDMLVQYKKNHPSFQPVMPKGTSFRQAIHLYLDKNEKDWSKLGIDLLLGARTDAIMSTAHSQFLPNNLMKSLDSSQQQPTLVVSTKNLYPISEQTEESSLFTPLFIFSLLFSCILLLSFSSNHWIKIFLQGFDGVFFFLIGTLGFLLIFMWWGTDHSMTKNNYNLLWAWPTNIIAAFLMPSQKKWVQKYFGIQAVALLLLLISWFFLPQQLNTSLIPIVLLMIFRTAKKYLKASS